ncbi:hypothetical protein LC082_13900 [Microbacterium esteraromaticum]|uniref:hypothetical protein n=1 Tax=Microbacterium esteraromaticum TaxID=57043 RepID=UPI001CD589DF|nr:hypothetical protein [Microbacterium esteraromaticum]MCA1307991.1 hypothetical protein [Microbacterium esteraromaticum]
MAAKPRVHEVAHELGIDSRMLLAFMRLEGEFAKGPSQTIEPPVRRRIRAGWEANGTAFARQQRELSPGIAALGELDWSPRSLPSNLRRVSEQYRSLYSSSLLVRMLRGALDERRFLHARSAEVLDLEAEGVPLPLPEHGVMHIADSQRLLVWSPTWHGHIAIPSLSTPTPDMRLRKYSRERALPELLVQIARLLTPELGRTRTGPPIPVSGTRQRPMPDVVLVYRSSGDGGGASPAVRHAPDHRWNVRGHHRRQWFPKSGEHRVIWIDEHTAGAKDARFVDLERIEVF